MPDETAPDPAPRRPLLTLRATLILMIAVLIASAVGVMCSLEGLRWVEMAAATGGTFAGVVTFFHAIIE